MRVPYYLFALAVGLAVAIGACSEGPTSVTDESALSGDATLGAKKDKVDICHWDPELNEGAGALVHLSVNGNAWDGPGDGCGGKVNPQEDSTGHNGHDLDVNFNPDTFFVATACEAFCYEDQDGDGLTDDVDPCILDADNDSDGDGVCLSDGDTCYADVSDSDGGDDADGDGWCDDNDNCVDVANDQTNSDGDSHGDACDNCPVDDNEGQDDVDGDGSGDVCDACTDVDGDGFCAEDDDCDDSDGSVNPDATEVCDDAVDNDCDGNVDLADDECTV